MLQNRGVWEPMSRSCDWRKVDQGEKRTLHQFPGIKNSEIGTDDFYKTKRGTNNPPANGNVTPLAYMAKVGEQRVQN